MTDLEKIELSILRVAERAPGPVGYWLRMLAVQIANDEKARRETPHDNSN